MLGAMTKLTEMLETIVENTSRDASRGSPVFPPVAPDTPGHVGPGMEPVGTPLPAGPPLPVENLMPGYASGVASYAGASGNDPAAAAAANPGTASVPPPPVAKAATNPRELTSTFICFCAESPGGVRNSGPSRSEVPCPRQGVYTRDRTTGQLRVVSPTGYDRAQASRITATWAPKGLASLHDGSGSESVRRVY